MPWLPSSPFQVAVGTAKVLWRRHWDISWKNSLVLPRAAARLNQRNMLGLEVEKSGIFDFDLNQNLWPGCPEEEQRGAEGMQIGCAGLKLAWVLMKGWDCKGWVQLGTAGFAAPFHPRDAQTPSCTSWASVQNS